MFTHLFGLFSLTHSIQKFLEQIQYTQHIIIQEKQMIFNTESSSGGVKKRWESNRLNQNFNLSMRFFLHFLMSFY